MYKYIFDPKNLFFGNLSYPSTLVCFHPPCGFYITFVHFGLYIVTLLGWSVHLVDFILFPSISWNLSDHPPEMIRPPCGLYITSVHFGLQIVTLLGWSVHLVDFILHPSVLWTSFCIRPSCGLQVAILVGWSVHLVDFKLSSFWDDPSTLWTSFCIRPSCGLQVAIVVGWSVHFWTSSGHPSGMIRPSRGL